MIAEGGIYIEDYSDIEQQVAEIAHVDLIEQELLDKPRDTVIIHMYLDVYKRQDEHHAAHSQHTAQEEDEVHHRFQPFGGGAGQPHPAQIGFFVHSRNPL